MTQYPSLHMIIDGEKVSGGGRRTFDVVNPATGEAIGALPLAEPADLDRALEVAASGLPDLAQSTPQERAAVLAGRRAAAAASARKTSPASPRWRRASRSPRRASK